MTQPEKRRMVKVKGTGRRGLRCQFTCLDLRSQAPAIDWRNELYSLGLPIQPRAAQINGDKTVSARAE
jgi:hypothetical protein